MTSEPEISPEAPGHDFLAEIRERLRAIYGRGHAAPVDEAEREESRHLPRYWKTAPRQQLLRSLDPTPRAKALPLPSESHRDHLMRHRAELTSAATRRAPLRA